MKEDESDQLMHQNSEILIDDYIKFITWVTRQGCSMQQSTRPCRKKFKNYLIKQAKVHRISKNRTLLA